MIEYRSANLSDYAEIRAFLADNGWEERVANDERFQLMLDNADRTVVALEEGRIVGFARALCDGVSNGYVGTVAVSADKRGLGIGRKMVTRLMGDDPCITWVLRAGHGSTEFWRKMGFSGSTIAMERNRSK